MLNWDKGKSEKAISSADYIQNMERNGYNLRKTFRRNEKF